MKAIRLIGLLVVLSSRFWVAQAQPITPDPSLTADPRASHRWVAKFAPFSLFDPDNTVQFGIERLVSRHSAVQLELGYGGQNLNLWQSTQNKRYSDREVWRGRAEWRYYFRQPQQMQGQYVALEGFYKQVNVHESGTIGLGCSTGNCQYYQLFTAPLQKYVWGGHLKIGRQLAFYDSPFLVDLYVGLGFRRRIVERYQPPADTYYYPVGIDLLNAFSTSPYALLSLSFGLKVGYSF